MRFLISSFVGIVKFHSTINEKKKSNYICVGIVADTRRPMRDEEADDEYENYDDNEGINKSAC